MSTLPAVAPSPSSPPGVSPAFLDVPVLRRSEPHLYRTARLRSAPTLQSGRCTTPSIRLTTRGGLSPSPGLALEGGRPGSLLAAVPSAAGSVKVGVAGHNLLAMQCKAAWDQCTHLFQENAALRSRLSTLDAEHARARMLSRGDLVPQSLLVQLEYQIRTKERDAAQAFAAASEVDENARAAVAAAETTSAELLERATLAESQISRYADETVTALRAEAEAVAQAKRAKAEAADAITLQLQKVAAAERAVAAAEERATLAEGASLATPPRAADTERRGVDEGAKHAAAQPAVVQQAKAEADARAWAAESEVMATRAAMAAADGKRVAELEQWARQAGAAVAALAAGGGSSSEAHHQVKRLGAALEAAAQQVAAAKLQAEEAQAAERRSGCACGRGGPAGGHGPAAAHGGAGARCADGSCRPLSNR